MTFNFRVEKTVHGVEIHRLSGKENVLSAAVSKEGHTGSLLGHERNISIYFYEERQL